MSIRYLVKTIGIALLLLPTAHAVVPVAPPAGEIVRFGLCSQRDAKSYAQPQSTAGYATTGPLRLTEITTDVPLRKGIGFGFVWRAHNLPDHPVITYRVEHPAITRPDGVTLTHFEEDLQEEATNGSIETIDCYMLSESHELVPGQWTLSVFFRGSLLARKSFQVYAPKP